MRSPLPNSRKNSTEKWSNLEYNIYSNKETLSTDIQNENITRHLFNK